MKPVESEPLFPHPDATEFSISDLGGGMGGMFDSDECTDSLMGEPTDSYCDAWLNADLSSLFAGESFLPSSSSDLNRVASSTKPSCHLHPWHAPMPVPVPPALLSDKSPCRSPPSPPPDSVAVDDKGKVVSSSPRLQSPESLPLLVSLVDCAQIVDPDLDRTAKTLAWLQESAAMSRASIMINFVKNDGKTSNKRQQKRASSPRDYERKRRHHTSLLPRSLIPQSRVFKNHE